MAYIQDPKQRQIAFWKKHQSIMKSCADLSTKCGVKVLVRLCFQKFPWREIDTCPFAVCHCSPRGIQHSEAGFAF